MAMLKDLYIIAIVSTFLLNGCLSTSVEQRLTQLEQNLKQKDHRIQHLEDQMIEKSAYIAKLEERIHILETVTDVKMDRNKEWENYFDENLNSNGEQRGDMESTKRALAVQTSSEENIAFHAYQKSASRTYGNHETLQFDREELDVGGCFNENDSIFDVPLAGVYVFTWTVVPNYFDYVQTELMVNGIVKGNAFSDSDEIHDVHPATATVVVSVDKGDHVFIRKGLNSNGAVISENVHARTTFSGWRLF